MKCDSFFLSVIIPVYNGERFLAEAVESIQRQAHQPLEIIIVDDGSTDNTATIAASLDGHIRYAFQNNSGPPAARNKGLQMARGNVISFLDADDLWSENKLEVQLGRLAVAPTVEIVLGRTQLMKLTELRDGTPKFEPWSEPVLAMSLGCAIVRRSAFHKVGLFDETLRHAEDWDWFMRARELGVSMQIHQEVMQLYRRHDRNITNQVELDNQHTIRMLKKSLDRRRQHNSGLARSLSKLSVFEEESTGRDCNSPVGEIVI